ncbi:cytochrome c oxidase assembly protein COX18, mitochondrial isoform X1 [Hylaeus volcanicus]|uniref:cytochrome c oxidase assembly protein COX18, mitochondrial isoform X1 n=2 Tax=Hylaeus volcanicus TaxID=313075 RepID=UPI0023B83934|nr:cytochrome c oxidase assembly protein COX18, mitochondrial isoform X1 [Hylaeus volcanicus]
MITRIFRKQLLSVKQSNSINVKYYHSVDNRFGNIPYSKVNTYLFSENKVLLRYLLNEQYTSKILKTSVQRTYLPMLNGLLCCKSNTILARANSVNNYPATINAIRQFSSSTPSVVDQAIVYNNGIIRSISESFPIECIMDALRAIHHSTGLPWWLTIILTTVLSRTCITLPLTIHQHQIMAKIENLQIEMKAVADRLKMETKMAVATVGWSSAHATSVYNNSIRKEWKELVVRENCHPVKIPVMAVLQMPIWLGFSFALRNMCYMFPEGNDLVRQDYLELTTGGLVWMKNLTEIDHTFILPIIFGFSSIAMIEIQCILHQKNRTKFNRIYINFIRVLTVCLVPVMAYIPSCLTLFWTTNTLCTLSHTLLLLSPKFRRLGKVPKTESELQHPYAELYKRIKERFRLQQKTVKK